MVAALVAQEQVFGMHFAALCGAFFRDVVLAGLGNGKNRGVSEAGVSNPQFVQGMTDVSFINHGVIVLGAGRDRE